MNENELTRRIDRLEVLMSEAVDAKNQAAEAKNDTLRADVRASFEGLRKDMAQREIRLMIWVVAVAALTIAILK